MLTRDDTLGLAAVALLALGIVCDTDLDGRFNERWIAAHPDFEHGCPDGPTVVFQRLPYIHPYSGASPNNFEEPLCAVLNSTVESMARHADVVSMLCVDKLAHMCGSEDGYLSREFRWPAQGELSRQFPIQGSYGVVAYLSLHAQDPKAAERCRAMLAGWVERYRSLICERPWYIGPHNAASIRIEHAKLQGDYAGFTFACCTDLLRAGVSGIRHALSSLMSLW